MIVEHVSFAVAEPEAVAAWYGKHFGMKVLRHGDGGDVFVADETGRVVFQLEDIRRITDSASQTAFAARSRDMRNLHLAFCCDQITATRQKLLTGGATADGDVEVTKDGDEMATLRDPWGLPVQLVKRRRPML